MIAALISAQQSSVALADTSQCNADLDVLQDSEIEDRATLCPDNASVLYHLGKSRIRSGDYTDARLVFLRALKKPDGVEMQLRLALGDVELHAGNYGSAAEIYAAVTEDFPEWYIAHEYLGFAYFADDELVLARTSLHRSLELQESAAAYRTLALVAYRLGDWHEAIEAVNRGYSMDEALISDRDFMISGIRSYTEIGRFDVARGLLAALLSSRPDLRTDDEFLRTGFYLKERMAAAGVLSE